MPDIRLARGEDVDAIKEELNKKVNISVLGDDGYLKKKIVGALPSRSAVFNFDDGKPLFKVPVMGSNTKGISEILTDDDGNMYQSVCSTGALGVSMTIGSNDIVYSEFDTSNLTTGASHITLEFDFKMNENKRMRVAIGDLDILRSVTGSTKYETVGIAADMFSSGSYTFLINGQGGTHASFFNAWLHCKFVIDFNAGTVQYSVFNKSNEADALSATVNFSNKCSEVTGIALYTWLADDTVCFDNIEIAAEIDEDADERTMYIIPEGDVFAGYLYIDGKPVCIGRSDVIEMINDLLERVTALENREE